MAEKGDQEKKTETRGTFLDFGNYGIAILGKRLS